MDIGALTATLGCDSSGLRKAEGDLRAFGSTANSTFDSAGSAAASCAGQLAAVAGVTLSLVGAFELAKQAVSSWYSIVSGGISILDNYKKQVISASYILTTMSDVPAPDLSKAYGQWKDYFAWVYEQSLRVDKMAASSAMDIQAVTNELTKKGIVPATEEAMNTVGRLTDLMKAVTPSYMNFEQQARGEIMAMVEGTARMGAQTAQILSQIDPAFKKNITSARENNTVMEYLASILPKINQYTKDLMGTWDAVGASLKSAWSVINIKAFGDAHREVVAFATELSSKLVDNGKLTQEGEQAARALAQAWESAKGYISEAMDYVLTNMPEIIGKIETVVIAMGRITGIAVNIGLGFLDIIDSVSQFAMNVQVGMVNVRAAIGYTIDWFQIMGTLIKEVTLAIIFNFSDIGPAVANTYASMAASSSYWANAAVQDANAVRSAVLNAAVAGKTPTGFSFMEGQTPAAASPVVSLGAKAAPTTPEVRPYTGKEGKGGGGGGGDKSADAEATRLASLFDTLTKDISKLSEGKLSEIEANYVKTVDQIYKKTETRAVTEGELVVLAKKRETLQKTKAEEEYTSFVAKNSGDQYVEIENQAKEWLTKYRGFKDVEKNVTEITGRQKVAAEVTRYTEIAGLQKTYLDAMSSESPYLVEQLAYKKQSLDIENKLALAAIDKTVADKTYLAYLKDEMVAHQALIKQAKEYTQERAKWATQGYAGGVKIAYVASVDAAAKYDAATVTSLLANLPSTLASNMATGFVNILQGKKTDFEALGWSMAESMIKTQLEGMITKIMPAALEGLMQLLGIEYTSKMSTAIAVANTSAAGGAAAGQNMIAGANEAAKTLSGKGGGVVSWITSAISSIGSLFGGSSMSLSEASSAGQGTNSAFNVTGSGSGMNFSLIKSAHGNIFDSGGYHPFASGGVVDRPTLFPFSGGTGLMGEDGAEAILPLRRLSGGDLGVQASGGGGSTEWTINVINKTSKPVQATAKRGGGGNNRELIIMLDEINAQLIDAGGKTSQAMDRRYNTSQSTTVRS